jgi:hypothetical protein
MAGWVVKRVVKGVPNPLFPVVRQQDRLVKTLLEVVDRTEKAEPDQRRLAMIYLGGTGRGSLLQVGPGFEQGSFDARKMHPIRRNDR